MVKNVNGSILRSDDMHEYTVLEVYSYNLKTSYDKLKLKNFKMDDKLKIGQNIILTFEKETLKVKLNSIVKTDDVNKKFLIDTNKFQMVAQLKKYFENKEQINN